MLLNNSGAPISGFDNCALIGKTKNKNKERQGSLGVVPTDSTLILRRN